MTKVRSMMSLLFMVGLVGPGISEVTGDTGNRISEEDVVDAQNAWGNAIVDIGKAYSDKKDYKSLAKEIVNQFYGYDQGNVLFKPTKASTNQFRLKKDEAISYFVTGIIPEDHGFAIQPWSKVRFENKGMIISENSAIAMGNYYFTDANTNNEVKVEYTFGYFKDDNGKIRINLHHSSFPYNPDH